MTIARMLADRDHVLLDFDGPICALFGGALHDSDVADRLRPLLGSPLPAHVERTGDPFDVLAYAVECGPATARAVEAQLCRLEGEAVATAPETPGAADALRGLWQAGYTLTIVSNNATEAIRSYLHLRDLAPQVRRISARNHAGTPLKPHPFLVQQAIEALGTSAEHCVLVGDSTADVDAGHAAGVPVIGYVPNGGSALPDADATIGNMAELRSGPARP